MANLNALNKNRRSVDEPPTKLDVTQHHGRMRVSYDTILLAAELGASDTITFGFIPAGAMVHEVVLRTDGALDTTALTLQLGIASNVNMFMTTAQLNATAALAVTTSTLLSVIGPGFQASVDEDVILTFDGVSDAASGRVIQVWVKYTLD